MKILYLAFARIPTEKAHGVQIMKTCEALGESGAEVELVVPSRMTQVKEDPFSYYGVRQNFKLTVLGVADLVRMGTIGFAVSAILFSELAARRRSFWGADIIYSRDAFLLFQYYLLGRRLVYEAHTKPTLISTIVARNAYRVVVISEGLQLAYTSKGVSRDKIIVAHDASSIDFKHQISKEDARKNLKIPTEGKVALYVGRIDDAKGVPTLAAAATRVGAQVVVVGDGPTKESLKIMHPNVLFLPQTKYEDLPRVLPAGDVLVIPNSAKNEDSALYTSPMKLFAYLGSGKPIVATDVPALRTIAGETEGVYFANADDPAALAAAIDHALAGPIDFIDKRNTMYTWTDRARTILDGIS